MYDKSKFTHEPNLASFQREREDFWKLIEYIYELLPGVKIFYYEGNHELRFQRYMMSHAPEIYGVSEFSIRFLFNLDELGITWIGDKRTMKAGKLNLPRWLFLRAKDNSIMGDRHQRSEHSGNVINGHIITCWSIGCLCQTNPMYMPLNEWQQGFGHLRIVKDKNFIFKNIAIINGNIY
jgi:hypothetical protein